MECRMHVVINRLPIRPDADWTEFCRKIEAFDALATAASPDFRGISLIRNSGEEAVIFVQFATLGELERVSRDVAAPWFAENIRPFLAAAVNRTVGEVVAGRLVKT